MVAPQLLKLQTISKSAKRPKVDKVQNDLPDFLPVQVEEGKGSQKKPKHDSTLVTDGVTIFSSGIKRKRSIQESLPSEDVSEGAAASRRKLNDEKDDNVHTKTESEDCVAKRNIKEHEVKKVSGKNKKVSAIAESLKAVEKDIDDKICQEIEGKQEEAVVDEEVLTQTEIITFEDLGLAEWLTLTCRELGMRNPTPVQKSCIPAILDGKNVVGIAQTGSGKTAAFALPILQKLALDPYGVFALVLTPTRELAMQLADQFRALGSGVHLRDAVVIGGTEMTTQAQRLAGRPHVVIATPGRLRDHLQSDPNMYKVFARTKFLVLDEADRLLDVGFEEEVGAILEALPTSRQTLLFSATMTTNLKALQEIHLGEGAFVYEAYSGFQTVELLKQEYLFIPANVKEVYLFHLMGDLEEKEIRSVIVFTSTCRACHLLSLTLAELNIPTVALHSLQSQGRRLAALAKFRTGQVPILIATDVASRGLDIPTVDLVVNYDIPRFTRDYVHRVGRTARAGRGGGAISLVTQYDVSLVQSIEALIERKLEEYTIDEDTVLKGITKVFKAKRTALLKVSESGFDDLVKARKESNRKARAQKTGEVSK